MSPQSARATIHDLHQRIVELEGQLAESQRRTKGLGAKETVSLLRAQLAAFREKAARCKELEAENARLRADLERANTDRESDRLSLQAAKAASRKVGRAMPGYTPARERANRGWGSAPPAWVVVMADECDRTSQKRVATCLRVSESTISQVLANAFQGPTDHLRSKVVNIFGATPLVKG